MRLAAYALLLGSTVGCEERTNVVVIDAPADARPDAAQPTVPLELPMNIVVDARGLTVYMDGKDKYRCDCASSEFPAVGERTIGADGFPCGQPDTCPDGSCLTDLGVEVDGVRLAGSADGGWVDPWSLSYDPFPTGMTTLVIAGCGHPQTRIPIDRLALPAVTVIADYVGGHPRVSWTTSLPVVSTMATISSAVGFTMHVPGTVTEYTETDLVRSHFAFVSAYVSRVEITTALGPTTVWHAGRGDARFPP